MGKKLLPVHKIDFTNDEELKYEWYTVKTVFNYEQAVADAVMKRAQSMDCENLIVDVMVPVIETVEMVKDKKGNMKNKVRRTKVFGLDNQIWVKMIMNNHTWNVVRQTTGCLGFLNADGNGRPLALRDFEVEKIKEILGLIEIEKEKAKGTFNGKVGQKVKVVAGAMNGFEGTITELNTEKAIVKVTLDNSFKIEADFYQVETI